MEISTHKVFGNNGHFISPLMGPAHAPTVVRQDVLGNLVPLLREARRLWVRDWDITRDPLLRDVTKKIGAGQSCFSRITRFLLFSVGTEGEEKEVYVTFILQYEHHMHLSFFPVNLFSLFTRMKLAACSEIC